METVFTASAAAVRSLPEICLVSNTESQYLGVFDTCESLSFTCFFNDAKSWSEILPEEHECRRSVKYEMEGWMPAESVSKITSRAKICSG